VPTNSYEMPAWGSGGDTILGWMIECVQEGEAWLGTQRPSRDWTQVLDMISTNDPAEDLKGLSSCGYDRVSRNARDIVASLSSFTHAGEYRPRFDSELYAAAHVLTNLDKNWHTETHAATQQRANIQNAVVFGTGYLLETFRKDFWGSYGDIDLQPIGPNDVTFVQLPKDHDIQQAYVVLIRQELPINLAKAMYENIAHQLVPDRDRPGWLQKGLEKLQRLMGGSPALRVAGSMSGRRQTGSFPTVDIFHAYIMDRSVNESPSSVTMGTHGTNWSYAVPALGSPMPTALVNPATGEYFTRPADRNDCRLFPLRRYCVFSRTAVAYDGSSPWWHGQVPLARTRFNDWAWEALGKSLLSDTRTMQNGIIAIMRYIEDACAARLDPPALYDDQLVSEGFAKAFNPRKAGVRAAASLQMGDVIKFPVPVQHYDVPTWITEWIKQQEARIDHQMGTPDLVAVAKAKQVPGEGTLEKLLEMAGPLVDDMFRSMEVPQHQLGEWRKAYYFQFYTHPRIIQVTGVDEGQDEDFEFTPDLIVPVVKGEALSAKLERTRRYLHEFKFHQTESSINERRRMVNKLALLQLKKSGVKIDSWTIARAWGISNYGPEPSGTHTVLERWIAEAHMDRELAEELQGGQGQPPQRGRPPTNQKPPQLVTKDGGTRSTIKTS
jgi:hypothetical protein